MMPEAQKSRIQQLFVWSSDPAKFDGNLMRRWHSVQTGLAMYERHPWVGVGYGYHVFEALYMGRLFEQHGNNISRIARDAGVDRHLVRKLLRKHGINE